VPFITTKETDNVFKLPRRAIFENNKVFTVDSKNKLRIQKVNIIAYQDNEVITEGLDDNTLVVSEPLLNASKGTIVKAMIK